MERLTTKEQSNLIECTFCSEQSNCYENHSCDEIEKAIGRLREYENLEEHGLLLKLPFKVGDTVWELCKCDDGLHRIFPMKITKMLPYGSVRWIEGKEPTVWNIYAISDCTDMYKNFYDLGKTLFLTKEEAEAKLKEMEGK